MGAIRKLTGVQGQIDAANRNTRVQAEAAAAAAEAAAAQAQAQAQAAADSQRNTAERSQIEADITANLKAPDQVDVQLDAANTNSVGATRRRQATFGRNYSAGAGSRI